MALFSSDKHDVHQINKTLVHCATSNNLSYNLHHSSRFKCLFRLLMLDIPSYDTLKTHVFFVLVLCICYVRNELHNTHFTHYITPTYDSLFTRHLWPASTRPPPQTFFYVFFVPSQQFSLQWRKTISVIYELSGTSFRPFCVSLFTRDAWYLTPPANNHMTNTSLHSTLHGVDLLTKHTFPFFLHTERTQVKLDHPPHPLDNGKLLFLNVNSVITTVQIYVFYRDILRLPKHLCATSPPQLKRT